MLPEDDAPVDPDVPELLEVPLVPLLPLVPVEGDLYSGDDLAESLGATLPDALPLAEPMPDAEPDTDPLASGVLAELPDEELPLGVDDAHAASVKAQTTGMIHFFIEFSFLFFVEISRNLRTPKVPATAQNLSNCKEIAIGKEMSAQDYLRDIQGLPSI